MANNFFLNNDPLLFNNSFTKSMENVEATQRQLNDAMMQYKMYQQQQNQPTMRDYLGELDALNKSLSDGVISNLMSNSEFKRLSDELTSMVQVEIMSNIKWRINSNPNAIKNIERQTSIINETNRSIENEQRESINELNDYVKNYSNITFEEYRRIKNGDVKPNKSKKQTNK